MKKIIEKVNAEFGKGEIWAIVCVFVVSIGLTIFPVLRTLADEIRGLTQYSDTTGKSTKILPIPAINTDTLNKINADRLNLSGVSHNTLTDTGANTHPQLDGHLSATGNAHSATAADIGADTAGLAAAVDAKWGIIDRCGWTSTALPSMQFDSDTRTLTISGAATYMQTGVLKTMTNPTSCAIPAAAGGYFFYIDGTTGLDSSTTAWTLLDTKIPVAYVLYDSTKTPAYLLEDERHSSLIDRRSHWLHHSTEGVERISGGTPDPYTYTISTDTDSAKRYGVDAALIADEDMRHSLAALPKPTGGNDYLVMYRDGAGGWTWKQSPSPFSYTTTGFIEYDDGTGTLNDSSNGRYVNYYLALTNIQGQGRFILIPGQADYATAALAYAETPSSLSFAGFNIQEVVIAYQITYSCTNGYSTTGKCVMVRAPQLVTTSVTAVNNPSQAVAHDSLTGITSTGAAPYYHVTLDSISAWDSGSGGGMTEEQVAQLATTVNHLDSTTTAHGGIVPSTRTVNGKALSGDITILPTDLTLDSTHRFVTDTDTARWNAASLPTVIDGDTDRMLVASYTSSGVDTGWSTTPNNSSSQSSISIRMSVPITVSGSLARVKFDCNSGVTVAHASIGVEESGGSTVATPVELKFSEASGFSSVTGIIRSDYASIALTSGTNAVIVMDITSGTVSWTTTGFTGTAYYKAGATSYATADISGLSYTSQSNQCYLAVAVEIQTDVVAEWIKGPRYTDISSGIPLSYLDSDTTMTANSDSKVPTQKAVKAHNADALNITTNNLAIARMPTGGNWQPSTTLNVDSQSGGATLSVNPTTHTVSMAGKLTVDSDAKFANLGQGNILINSDFSVRQRGVDSLAMPASDTLSNTYVADMFAYAQVSSARVTMDVTTDTTQFLNNFNVLRVTATTADTSVDANDYARIKTSIEGNEARGFFGKIVTMSFWVKSHITGTYGVMFGNGPGTRMYCATYTVDAADTWERKELTFTFETATADWYTDTREGVWVAWSLMAGSSKQIAANNVWGNSWRYGADGQTNALTTGGVFCLAQPKLEIGSVATPYVAETYSSNIAKCQWRLQKIGGNNYGLQCLGYRSAGSQTLSLRINHLRPMSGTPTPAVTGSWYASNVGAVTVTSLDANETKAYANSSGAGMCEFSSSGSSFYILLSTEL